MDWREEVIDILSRIDKYEKLGGLRALATFVKNALYSDRDYLDNISLDFRWYTESADIRARFIDPYYQIEVDLGYVSIKHNDRLEDLRQKLLEKKIEFTIKALAMLVSELEDALYRAQQKCEDP